MHDHFAGGADDEAAAVESFGVVNNDDELFVFSGPGAGEEFVVGLVGGELVKSIRIRGEWAEHEFRTKRPQATRGLGDLAIETDHGAEFESVIADVDWRDMKF